MSAIPFPIRRLMLGFLLLAAMLFAVAFALPGHLSVARSTVIEAPETVVFPYVNNPERFLQWSPWAPRDPDAVYRLSGPDEGTGARMEWRGTRMGDGISEIVESRPNELVRLAMALDGMGAATTYYRLSPAGAGTRLTWGFETDLGANPVLRWMGLLQMRRLTADFESGLARLKEVVEGPR